MSIPYIKEAGALVLLAALGWAGHWLYEAGANSERVRTEKIIGEFAKAEADAQAKARKAEQDKAAEVARIAEKYEQDKINAQTAADRLVADLRAGNVRLRSEWAGCATDRVSQIGTSAAELDAAEQRRREGAANLVRLADQWDAKERALQDTIRSDRAGQGAEPAR